MRVGAGLDFDYNYDVARYAVVKAVNFSKIQLKYHAVRARNKWACSHHAVIPNFVHTNGIQAYPPIQTPKRNLAFNAQSENIILLPPWYITTRYHNCY